MTNPPTDERGSAFEKWATEEHGAWLDKDSHGRYTIPAEESMWLGYQAALSHHGEVLYEVENRGLRKGLRRGYEMGQEGQSELFNTTLASWEREAKEGRLTALISKAEKV